MSVDSVFKVSNNSPVIDSASVSTVKGCNSA